MTIEIAEISPEPRGRTQQLVQALTMLDLYQAELARILRLQCADIAAFCNAQTTLEPNTESWRRSHQFIFLYQLLYQKLAADGVQMRHWLRRRHPCFGQTPQLMLVDENRLDELLEYLQSAQDIFV
jgi:hypothetical protein